VNDTETQTVTVAAHLRDVMHIRHCEPPQMSLKQNIYNTPPLQCQFRKRVKHSAAFGNKNRLAIYDARC